MKNITSVLSGVILLILLGCSGGSPASPDSQPIDYVTNGLEDVNHQSNSHLLGLWDVYIDTGNGTVELLENRQAMFTLNLTNILSKQVAGLDFELIDIIIEPDYIDVDIDIIVTHPFPGYPEFNGYDLRGIFMGDGSLTLEKGSLKYPEWGVDQYMLPDTIDGAGGPDGYTRWYNFTEFSEADFPLFSFTAGKITSPDFAGTATLCPYKYFADGLQPEEDLWNWLKTHKDQNGVFSQSVTNSRNFYIRFPTTQPELQFSVAVIVSWEGLEPEYHPANCPEAIACDVTDNSYVYYVDPTENGGYLNLDISLFGWDYQPSKIYIESTVLNSVYEFTANDMNPVDIGDHYATYHVEIPADNVTGIEGQELWVIAEYESFDYTNDFGVPNLAGTDPLAACFRYDLEVASVSPPWIVVLIPNGGEEWLVGTEREITWDSWNFPGTVFIDYSKDNFVDDINHVAIDELNDGSFIWEIPDDPSDTVRVRISSTDDPGVYDISDEDFTILLRRIVVLIPNGGEDWGVETEREITWDSWNVPGTVFIDYSKDNFVDDINPVAIDEPNDGSFIWEIPDDPSDIVRVRISASFRLLAGHERGVGQAMITAGKLPLTAPGMSMLRVSSVIQSISTQVVELTSTHRMVILMSF